MKISKNGLIISLLIVSLILIYVVYSYAEKQKYSDVSTVTSQNSTSTNVSDLTTYNNSKYNFSIKYPKDYTITENDENYGFNLSIKVPSDYQKGTDFNVGSVNITEGTSTKDCYISNYGNENMTGVKIIGGKEFHYDIKQPFDDAAMGGQRGKVLSFAIINDGLCYRIEKMIGYRDLRGFSDGPYPPHFNEKKVNSDLDIIISSFNFNK